MNNNILKKFNPPIKRELGLILFVILFSIAIRLVVNLYISLGDVEKLHKYIIYCTLIGSAVTCLIGFLESKDNDPFVTGKTQTMGVVNSYMVSPICINIFAINYGFLLPCAIYCIVFFISHYIGILSRKRTDK